MVTCDVWEVLAAYLPPIGRPLCDIEFLVLVHRFISGGELTSVRNLSSLSGLDRRRVRQLLSDFGYEILTNRSCKMSRIEPKKTPPSMYQLPTQLEPVSKGVEGTPLFQCPTPHSKREESLVRERVLESTEIKGKREADLVPVSGSHSLLRKNYSASFDAFWKHYPSRNGRKVGKQQAWRSWLKISPSGELLAQIAESLSSQVKCEEWAKDNGRFIPMASTWLNGHRWEDEVILGGEDDMTGLSSGAQEAIRRRKEQEVDNGVLSLHG